MRYTTTNNMKEVRIALISWEDEEGLRRLHLLDHTPEQQAKVQQTLQTLEGAKRLTVFRFNGVVAPGLENYIDHE